MLRQHDRAKETSRIIHSGEGIDDRFKLKNIKVFETDKPFDTFEEDVIKVLNDVNVSCDCKTAVVEGCLLVIAIKTNKGLDYNGFIQKEINKFEENSNSGGIGFDWGYALTKSQLYKPIFLQPIGNDLVHDLLFRDKIVVIYFSFEAFRKRFSSNNFTIEVLTGKKFKKINGRYRGCDFDILANKKCALVFKTSTDKVEPFSYGIFDRIPSFLIKPSHFLYLQKFMNQETL